MRSRWRRHGWPFLVLALGALGALGAACDDDTPVGTGGGAGTAGSTVDSGTTGAAAGTGGTGGSGGGTLPPRDGGLVPCMEMPTYLDMPPSGQLPCDLLPPGFVAP